MLLNLKFVKFRKLLRNFHLKKHDKLKKRTDMNYMNYFELDLLNGPGVRSSLFVSGCEHKCKNCFSKASHDFKAGNAFTHLEEEKIFKDLSDTKVVRRGLSLLGGDPFHPKNAVFLIDFLKRLKKRIDGKDIWAWTGFVYEALSPEQLELASLCDVLVDGPFIKSLHEPSLVFKGSSNQRLIDLKKMRETGSKEVIILTKY